MAKSAIVSIDLTKLMELVTAQKKLTKSAKNGHSYVSLEVYLSDEQDQYGNTVAVSLNRTKAERDSDVKRSYVGNGRHYEVTPKEPEYADEADVNDLAGKLEAASSEIDAEDEAKADESDDLPF